MNKYLIILLAAFFLSSCVGNKSGMPEFSELTEQLGSQLKVLVDHTPSEKVPRSYPDEDGGYWMVGINDWTCGFPAGSFWYMYELTGDVFWKEVALENTLKLEGVQYRTNTHDLGFMVFCSYGNAYRLTGNEDYKKVILQASESLMTRFNPTVGCIRSWDHGNWQFPVIIDNMMNLEMLFWASEVTGDPKYSDAAISHANVTIENHFRDDWSSYHVVDFDTITGQPIEKVTHQGLSDESAWGRGQAWGLYGFIMTYRETTDEKYLNVAENIAGFIMENLPEDGVSYWDYNDPDIPETNRDASAAAITASALFELSLLADDGQKYLDAANKIVESLTSEKYRATGGTNGGFILKHSVGHKPANSEVDVAINYADYYYLEALKRQQEFFK
ncbi:MAG: glycoside hydrolase family 88 protein [Tangfeifania sp.]